MASGSSYINCQILHRLIFWQILSDLAYPLLAMIPGPTLLSINFFLFHSWSLHLRALESLSFVSILLAVIAGLVFIHFHRSAVARSQSMALGEFYDT